MQFVEALMVLAELASAGVIMTLALLVAGLFAWVCNHFKKSKYIKAPKIDRCVVCGVIVPEGRMLCRKCEAEQNEKI